LLIVRHGFILEQVGVLRKSLIVIFRYSTLFLMMVMFTLVSGDGQAQSAYQYRLAEKVGFAFYKLVGRTPDFDPWITNLDAWKNAKEKEKPSVLADENDRLRQGFSAFDPAIDVLPIQSSVEISFDPLKETDLPHKIYSFRMVMKKEGPVYFPYFVGTDIIAIVPDRINDFLTISMRQAEYKNIYDILERQSLADLRKMKLMVDIRPLRADGTSPMLLDGEKQWVMMGAIGSIALYDKKDVLIWAYQAPWYKSVKEQSLNDLYRKEFQ
jgi:hypothetical protein